MMRQHHSLSLTVVVLLFACACFSIADFDPAIATDATTLQQTFDDFLTDLAESAGTPDGDYLNHTEFYEDARKTLERLKAEAIRHPGNDLTLQSLGYISENLDELERIHRLGISPAEVRVIARIFDSQFRMLIDLENAKAGKEP